MITELQTFQPNSSNTSHHFNSFYMPVHLILLHSTVPTMPHAAVSPNTPSPSIPQFVSAPYAQSYLTMPSTANILRRWWRSEWALSIGGMTATDKISTGWRTCPSATVSTVNPTFTDLGSNPALRTERLTTDRLSHSTAPPCSQTPSLYGQL